MPSNEIHVCPHCNNQMRPWKKCDYLPDFAEIDGKGDPIRRWWVCPGTPSAFTQTFYPVKADKWLGRWRDKKGVWHNVLNWDLDRMRGGREGYPAFFETEEEARQKVHEWGNAHLNEVDLVSIELAHQ